MPRIIEIYPIGEWTISLIIHINNICNFKCSYCTAGQHRDINSLKLYDIINIINSIKEIIKKFKNIFINIDITLGELGKFFIF